MQSIAQMGPPTCTWHQLMAKNLQNQEKSVTQSAHDLLVANSKNQDPAYLLTVAAIYLNRSPGTNRASDVENCAASLVKKSSGAQTVNYNLLIQAAKLYLQILPEQIKNIEEKTHKDKFSFSQACVKVLWIKGNSQNQSEEKSQLYKKSAVALAHHIGFDLQAFQAARIKPSGLHVSAALHQPAKPCTAIIHKSACTAMSALAAESPPAAAPSPSFSGSGIGRM